MQEKFITLSYKEVRDKLIPIGIVFTKIVKTEDTIKDPQTNLNNMFMDMHGELIKDLKVVSPPLNIENAPRKKAIKAPKLGEHNIEILKELGYTEEEKKGINNFVDTVLVNNLINVLEADNPNFSRGRFLIAINDTEQV